MGIKRPICQSCEWLKETKKINCKYPDQRPNKMEACSGYEKYYPIWKETADFINKNYKIIRRGI